MSKLYESESEALTFLEYGNVDQRVWAIVSLDDVPKNYDLFWRIFISDENKTVRGNALSACYHCRPDKLWEMLAWIIDKDTDDNTFTRQIAKYLLEENNKF